MRSPTSPAATTCSRRCARGVRGWLPRSASRATATRSKDTILWEIERAERLTADDIARAEVTRTELYHRMRQFFERLRVLRAADGPGAAVRRRAALPDRDRRRDDGHLHRLDEVLLLHLGRRQSRDLGAVRVHARRACRSGCRSSRGITTTGGCCRSRTRSSRRRESRTPASRVMEPDQSSIFCMRQPVESQRIRVMLRYATAPDSRNAAISESLNPASRRTTSVCSPSSGARRRTSGGVALILIGDPSVRRRPSVG